MGISVSSGICCAPGEEASISPRISINKMLVLIPIICLLFSSFWVSYDEKTNTLWCAPSSFIALFCVSHRSSSYSKDLMQNPSGLGKPKIPQGKGALKNAQLSWGIVGSFQQDTWRHYVWLSLMMVTKATYPAIVALKLPRHKGLECECLYFWYRQLFLQDIWLLWCFVYKTNRFYATLKLNRIMPV